MSDTPEPTVADLWPPRLFAAPPAIDGKEPELPRGLLS